VEQASAWDRITKNGRNGTGNWLSFDRPVKEVFDAAEIWKDRVKGIDKPWLCWNVHDDWCLVQQKLILSIGWTPVLGWDPNLYRRRPPHLPGTVVVDFNEELRLKAMWPHFPLEFAFLWAKKLAFWHADLLVRVDKLSKLALLFDQLQDGEMAAVISRGGFRNLLNFKTHRYWELLGCTTQQASKDQFEKGSGWWRHIENHPNCREQEEKTRRKQIYYDHGVGIMYWKRHYGGKIVDIGLRSLKEGHFSAVGAKKYKSGSSKTDELEQNYSLADALKKLDLELFA
jgi:hypothetical protein